jgi:hypothetical protein
VRIIDDQCLCERTERGLEDPRLVQADIIKPARHEVRPELVLQPE